jgi:hypothetical protein
MSRTAPIEYDGQMLWAYDESRGIWMKHLIDAIVDIAPDAWTDAELDGLRATASLGSAAAWTIELTAEQRPHFLAAARQATDRLAAEDFLSRSEAQTRYMLEDLPLIRHSGGHELIATAPLVQLGNAVIALVEGTLEPPPPRNAWYFTDDGRETIRMGW